MFELCIELWSRQVFDRLVVQVLWLHGSIDHQIHQLRCLELVSRSLISLDERNLEEMVEYLNLQFPHRVLRFVGL